MKIYLDTSVYNRPFDEQDQPRIWLEKQGFKAVDALHLACAESVGIDYFLTCDDKVAKRYKGQPMVVCNPVEFILKVTEGESIWT
jgi:hypothetical protein